MVDGVVLIGIFISIILVCSIKVLDNPPDMIKGFILGMLTSSLFLLFCGMFIKLWPFIKQ